MNDCKCKSGYASRFRRFLFLALFGMLTMAAYAQNQTVSGTVTDDEGEPLIGASVVIKGQSTGVATDIDGNYTISNVPSNGTLEFRYVGYSSQTIAVNGRTKIDVVLKNDAAMLNEVVAVGYGVQKKSDVTGAMSSVTGEDLNTRPVSNAFEALQGKAAGVDITTNERPGTIGSIRIRGNRSLTASNDPLYVVDGVPLMSSSAIETLNPRDIESIDILKDASATAIYGSRGANGVIIVTTKQGKAGQFSLTYSGTITTSKIVDKSPSMSAGDFVTFRRWAAHNADPNTYPEPSQFTKELDTMLFDSPLDGQTSRDNVLRGWAGGTWDPSKIIDTDWTDFVTQTGFSHEHTISASGGTDKMNSFASFGYLSNDGTQKGQKYERYTAKISTNITPVKWFSLSFNMNASHSKQDYGMSTLGAGSSSAPDAIYGAAKAIYNMAVPYDAEGNLVIQPGGESTSRTIMEEWNHSEQKREITRVLGSFAGTLDIGKIWSPLEGLSYKIAFGPDFRYWREGAFIDGKSSLKINADGTPGTNWARKQSQRDFSWTLDNMIMYNRTFNKKHNVGLTLLQTASEWNVESTSMNAQNIAKDSFKWNAFGSIDLTDTNAAAGMSTGLVERSLESYMIRVNYGFDDKYLLTASGRWDGASQLAEGHKWDFFPSMALGWRMKQEEFLKDVTWLSNLKLRVGVGTSGNAAVDPYKTIGSISSIFLPFNGMGNVLGYTTNEPYYVDISKNGKTMANPNLGWEKTTQWNVGVDFAFLNNRISGQVDFYTSKTKDLLMAMSIPTLTGFSTTFANVGKTSNKGVEFTINAIPVQTAYGLTWETSFNAAWQKDRIDELAYGKNDMVDNGWFIGESMGIFYGYDNAGLWQDTPEDRAEMAKWAENGTNFSPGMVRPVDQNGDYKMGPDDRVILGNTTPRWTLGWTNSFTWKGFELGFQIFGRLGYKFNTNGEAMTAHANQREIDYWTPDNPNAEWQKPILGQATAGSGDPYSSLLGYKKGGFLKMRNISVGYNFNTKIFGENGLKRLRAYAQVINPFSFYNSIKGYDLDTGRTYFNRSFVFGIEVGF